MLPPNSVWIPPRKLPTIERDRTMMPRATPKLRTILRRVRQADRHIVASIEGRSGLDEITADYIVITLPASTLRDVAIEPALPDGQRFLR